jgi:hypothetical protein
MSPGFIHTTSTRADGNMSFAWGPEEEVRGNRAAFLAGHGLKPEDCVVLNVGDGNAVKETGKTQTGKEIEADALITKEKGVFLFLVTGDCLPIACFDPVRNAVGLGHASRKSTDLNLARAMVETMGKRFGSDPKDMRVSIGPGIHKDSYLIEDPEQKGSPEWQPFLMGMPDGRTTVDLVGYNIEQMVQAGIRRENIEVSPVDTAASPQFFSHYRSVRTGEPENRFVTVIGISG